MQFWVYEFDHQVQAFDKVLQFLCVGNSYYFILGNFQADIFPVAQHDYLQACPQDIQSVQLDEKS